MHGWHYAKAVVYKIFNIVFRHTFLRKIKWDAIADSLEYLCSSQTHAIVERVLVKIRDANLKLT